MKELKDSLEEQLKPLYYDLIAHTRKECEGNEICPFIVQWGKNFPIARNEGILFVGRATNGWLTQNLDVDTLFNGDDRIFNCDNQMIWVEECEGSIPYNSNKSAFWRVIRAVARHFYPQNELEYIAWSNVCKLAPNGGNPNNSLYYAQLSDACRIFRAEIEILSPKYVIMLTGYNWGIDFLRAFNDGNDPRGAQTLPPAKWDYYHSSPYKIKNKVIILSEHPQGKKERSHVKCLINIIKNTL